MHELNKYIYIYIYIYACVRARARVCVCVCVCVHLDSGVLIIKVLKRQQTASQNINIIWFLLLKKDGFQVVY